ncbi:MAG: hypothetical protein RIR10_1267, partial [Planctomycetota bacterium]
MPPYDPFAREPFEVRVLSELGRGTYSRILHVESVHVESLHKSGVHDDNLHIGNQHAGAARRKPSSTASALSRCFALKRISIAPTVDRQQAALIEGRIYAEFDVGQRHAH